MEGFVMKTKLLGLLALLAWLGLSPASATTYNVDFSIGGGSGNTVAIGSFTGYIDTSCDSCYLTSSNVSSWLIAASDGTSASSSGATSGISYYGTVLQATPTGIYTSGGSGGFNFEFCGDVSNCNANQQLSFQVINGGYFPTVYIITWYEASSTIYQSGGFGWPVHEVASLATPIGPFCQAGPCSETPLPAALPLFAGGLGVIGLIAGRKKRKADVPVAT